MKSVTRRRLFLAIAFAAFSGALSSCVPLAVGAASGSSMPNPLKDSN